MKYVPSYGGKWNETFYAGNTIYISGKKIVLSDEEKELLIREIYKKEIDEFINKCTDEEFRKYLNRKDYTFLFENLDVIKNIIRMLSVYNDDSKVYIAILEKKGINEFFEISLLSDIEIDKDKIERECARFLIEEAGRIFFKVQDVNSIIFIDRNKNICFLSGRLLYTIKKFSVEREVDPNLEGYIKLGVIKFKR